jgi:hypothetical protein
MFMLVIEVIRVQGSVDQRCSGRTAEMPKSLMTDGQNTEKRKN